MATSSKVSARRETPQRQRRATTSREIIEFVRAQIYLGGMGPGERINQDGLAKEFGVSRLPVREALIALESEGLVRSELHRGVYVLPIARSDIEDHYDVYAYIQSLAAGRATPILTEENLASLEEIQSAFAAEKNSERLRDLDWQFHSIINRAGGSSRLLRILRQMGRALPQELYAMPPATRKLAVEEHQAILDALRLRDPALAARAAVEHTTREGEHLVQLLTAEGVLTETQPDVQEATA